MVSAMRGDDLLRVKGIVNITEHPLQPMVIHGVQHISHPRKFSTVGPQRITAHV